MSIGGSCHIIGRPVGANWQAESELAAKVRPSPPDSDEGADVMYGAPDDLIYELEPMLEMENGGSCKTRGRDCLNRVNMEKSVLIRRV